MKLKKLRRDRGWSQADLAFKAGVSPGYIGRLEVGRHDPKLSTLLAIAKAFNIDVKELL